MHSAEEKLGDKYLTSKGPGIPVSDSPNASGGGKVAPDNVKIKAKDDLINEMDPQYVERMT